MVTLSTPANEMVKELLEEKEKALYWFLKHFHGEKGYDKMVDALEQKAWIEEKTCISDIVEYISKKGNRWMLFEAARYYPKAKKAKPSFVSFCYYETYGSVGAFLIGYDQMDTKLEMPFVVIYTSHFFLRFCQRLGVEMRSRWMVQKFCEAIPGYLIYPYNDKKANGLTPIDVRLPGSLGRGFARMEGDNTIIEIRTYLTDPELSRKQLKETEEVRKLGDSIEYEPFDIWLYRLSRMRGEELDNEFCNKLEFMQKQGLPTELMQIVLLFSSFFTRFALDHDLFDEIEAAYYGSIMSDDIGQSFYEYYDKQKDWVTLCKDFINWVLKTFKNVDENELLKDFRDYMTEINKACKETE